jgi:hypothetical protein
VTIQGTVRVACPSCGTEHEVELVQSINTRNHRELKDKLLRGELGVLACTCGKRTRLAATLLYHDPDRDYFCQVCPGGEDAMAKGAAAFRAIGEVGTQRLVPSQNALVEKVKLLEAGLADWAIEMVKVLLLASIEQLDRVLLFDRVDDDTLLWVLFDAAGATSQVASPRVAYERIVASTTPPPRSELRIDRAWAVAAVQAMIAAGN